MLGIVNRRFASANRPISLAKIDDFHLKYDILEENPKNMILGETVEKGRFKGGLFLGVVSF